VLFCGAVLVWLANTFASILRDRFLGGVARGLGDLDWSVVSRLVRADAGLA